MLSRVDDKRAHDALYAGLKIYFAVSYHLGVNP